MSVPFNLKVIVPLSGHGIHSNKETFPAKDIRITSSRKSIMSVSCCSLNTSTDFMGKIRDKMRGKLVDVMIHPVVDIPSNLRMIDTLQSFGVDRYFQSEINTLLEDTYRLWKEKEKHNIFNDVKCCAMAFRLLREKGYQVSSDELGPISEQEMVKLQINDIATILELYKASQARMYEDEDTLETLHDWSSNLLKQQLLNKSIPDHKLHKQVEYMLKNYHGILDRVAVKLSLDLYHINDHYKIPEVADWFPNEDLLIFLRQNFNVCQAQHQKELQQLQRWYADCRLDKLSYGSDHVVSFAHFLASAIFGEHEFSNARLAFAEQIILVTRIDDFFDHAGSIEESYKILDLVQEWKEKPAEEYCTKEVEILFTAVYTTVNNFAEKASIEQGRCVKPLLIKLWVELLTSFKKELDSWAEEIALTVDEYLSFSWMSIGCRLCILNSLQFVGIKLSEEMLWSQECLDLCRHVSSVDRLLNDVQSFEKERLENTINSVGIQLAANKGEVAVTEEEAVSKIKEMVEYHRRKLMQIVYKQETVLPRECKDVFLRVCRIGHYLYSGDELISPQQMKEDMKSLVYEPVTLRPLEANKMSTKNCIS